jgi:hypothetical protein
VKVNSPLTRAADDGMDEKSREEGLSMRVDLALGPVVKVE